MNDPISDDLASALSAALRNASTPRERLYMRLQPVIAGEKGQDALAALADCMAVVAVQVTDDLPSACRLLMALGPDLCKTARFNWDTVKQREQQSLATMGAGGNA